jgi:hypothetical protein
MIKNSQPRRRRNELYIFLSLSLLLPVSPFPLFVFFSFLHFCLRLTKLHTKLKSRVRRTFHGTKNGMERNKKGQFERLGKIKNTEKKATA